MCWIIGAILLTILSIATYIVIQAVCYLGGEYDIMAGEK